MKCTITMITEKTYALFEIFLNTFQPLKTLFSSMLLKTVGRKSETDKYF